VFRLTDTFNIAQLEREDGRVRLLTIMVDIGYHDASVPHLYTRYKKTKLHPLASAVVVQLIFWELAHHHRQVPRAPEADVSDLRDGV
jgi:hypothetical protein